MTQELDERTNLSETEEYTCTLQGEFFEYVADMGIDMEWFIPTFLRSDVCNRELDAKYSFLHASYPLELFDFCEMEFGPIEEHKNGLFFNLDVALWLGYIYRQICIQTGIKSRDMLERIPLEKMCRYYAGLHTVADEMATDIICEDFHLCKIIRN